MRRLLPSPPCCSGETEDPGGEGHTESQHGSRWQLAGSFLWHACLERQAHHQEQLIGPTD